MEFTYRLTKDDYKQLFKMIRARAAARAKVRRLLLIVALALLLAGTKMLVSAWLSEGGHDSGWVFLATGIGFVWGMFFVWLAVLAARRLLRRRWPPDSDPMFAECRVRIDGGGVERFDPVQTTKFSWRAFNGISEHAAGVVLWLAGSNFGIFIPARVLTSEEARWELVRLAREQIALAWAASPDVASLAPA
jgi:hypothetical protein